MIRRVKMSDCPLCRRPITSNERTAWRSVSGEPTRVHRACLPEEQDA